ncbi:Ankyrin-1 [Colletotrichum siamense]|uniref:Ankyrin-1 n=1 Tax=Colletotrichum siamense TaxID=690259 RepID=A0A9P5EHR2_COLSI|nr:Ankyrin-1 [Colletotrichum siamense]KAF4842799.1 Ankyrin-1 [Colletotrichum siamense]
MEPAISMNDYTVGWVCALPLEMAAARAMLDELHPNPPVQDPADHNCYTLGQMLGHNVVIACLPAGVFGTTSAATVAKDMLRTFRHIRLGLMVGVGGGVPSEVDDIRLGDVIVSKPTGTCGGVIQYDLGKAVQGGGFERVGTLNAPPSVLLNALGSLEARHMCGDSHIPQILSDFVRRFPKMRSSFGHPGTAHDVLFCAEYDHVGCEPTCEQCDNRQTVQRVNRDDADPVVHYGTIGSGNSVIKDGRTRDQLRHKYKILCFEMEAAGLMQEFPCLVIRGVCDYADSHKNKKWQGYAAATAAAFAKELLSGISPANVLKQVTIPTVVSDPVLYDLVATITETIETQTHSQNLRHQTKEDAKCYQSFKTSQYEKFKNINPDRVEGTCNWVLEHPHFQQWLESPRDDLLWISADPGCGKSVLARSLVEKELSAQAIQNHTVCYFFFKDNEEQNTVATALCALLHQLFGSQPHLLSHAREAYRKNGDKLQSEVAELWRILIDASKDDKGKTAASVVNGSQTIICVLDALDECFSGDRKMLIERLTDFYTHRTSMSTRSITLKFLVTSRPYQDIASGFSRIPPELPSIRLAGEESNAEISREINLVISAAVDKVGRENQLNEHKRNILRRRLLETPNRTYLWLHLMIEELPNLDKSTSIAFQSDINCLPQSVEQAYERILSRHKGQRQKVEALLHIIVGARRPLNVMELLVAYQMAIGAPSPVKHSKLEFDSAGFKTHVREMCGLFVFVNDDRIFMIHQTAKEFLLARHGFPDPPYGVWRHSLHAQRSEAVMARLCVQYLLFEDIRDSCVPTNTIGTEEQADKNGENYLFADSAAYQSTHFLDEGSSEEDEMDHHVNELHGLTSRRSDTWASLMQENQVPTSTAGSEEHVDNDMKYPLFTYSATHWSAHFLHAKALEGKMDLQIDKLYDMRSKRFKTWTSVFWRANYPYRSCCGIRDVHLAALNGHDGALGRMLDSNGTALDVKDSGGRTPLIWASINGHEVVVQTLLDKGADINSLCNSVGTALQAASKRGHKEVIRLLLKEGANTNTQSEKHPSAIHEASRRGFSDIVAMLLGKGAYVNTHCGNISSLDVNDRIVIHAPVNLNNYPSPSEKGPYASMRRHLNRTKHGHQPNEKLSTPLLSAVSGGYSTIVEMLLRNGAETSTRDGSALLIAISRGSDDIVQILLERGVDINVPDENGNALWAAVSQGHIKIVRMLLEKGADMTMRVGNGSNTLLGAIARRRYDIVQILLQKGADFRREHIVASASDLGNVTTYGDALLIASFTGQDKIVQLLLDEGANANGQGGQYGTALQAASHEGHLGVIHILLNAGADIDAAGGTFGNALQIACREGHFDTVQALVNKGANINAQGGVDGTALQASSLRGHRKIVQMLLEQGAEVNTEQCGLYSNPLQAAVSNNHAEIVEMLLSRGADVNAKCRIYGMEQLRRAASFIFTEPGLGRKTAPLGREGGHNDFISVGPHDTMTRWDFLLTSSLHSKYGSQSSDTADSNRYNNALEAACQRGNAEVVQMLLNNRAIVNTQKNNSPNALQLAIRSQNEAIVEMILNRNTDVNAEGSALRLASQLGYEGIVQIILARAVNADVQVNGGYFGTALEVALNQGHVGTVRILLEYGANIDVSRHFQNCVKSAWLSGNEAIIQLLLERGTAITSLFGQSFGSVLWAVCSRGNEAHLRMLLDKCQDFDNEGGENGGEALQIASERGYEGIVRMLLDKGAYVNAPSKSYFEGTALVSASRRGHNRIVRMLLDKGANPNTKGFLYGNALHAAVCSGHSEIIQVLLNNGADVNMRHRVGAMNSLEEAVFRNNQDVVQILLDNGADVNAVGGEQGVALLIACIDENETIVWMLLNKGANVNLQGRVHTESVPPSVEADDFDVDQLRRISMSPLQAAVSNGNKRIVEILLSEGADIDVRSRSSENENALQLAISHGHDKIVELLLSNGADINAQDSEGKSTLQLAIVKGNRKIINMLLDRGVDVNVSSNEGSNALCLASLGGDATMVGKLIDKGAYIAAQSEKHHNAVWAASSQGYDRIVSMLLDKITDSEGNGNILLDAVYTASERGYSNIIRMLLDHGASPNATGGEESNALQVASLNGHTEAVRMLLRAGADANTRSGYYGDALQAASYGGHDATVGLLLKAGAVVNVTHGHFGGALTAASHGGHNMTVQTLLHAGADVDVCHGTFGGALAAASLKGHDTTVRLLLDSGAGVRVHFSNALRAACHSGNDRTVRILLKAAGTDADVNFDLGNALRAAVLRGHIRIMKTLLQQGADFKMETEPLDDVLQRAASLGYSQIVKMLLRTTNFAAWNEAVASALHASSREGHVDVISILLAEGIDINIQLQDQGSALYAASEEGHNQSVEMLLHWGADVNVKGGHFGNPLQAASSRGHERIVKMLLDRGAIINARGGYYGSALQAALLKHHDSIFQMLLQKCAEEKVSKRSASNSFGPTHTILDKTVGR